MIFTANTWKELNRINRQFDQVFTELADAKVACQWTPALELEDNKESYRLRVWLPNLERETLDIQATKKAIAISGKTYKTESTEDKKILYSEFAFGQFGRLIPLPQPIAHAEVTAEYSEGILTITLPKAPEAINRVVKVSLTGKTETQPSEMSNTQD